VQRLVARMSYTGDDQQQQQQQQRASERQSLKNGDYTSGKYGCDSGVKLINPCQHRQNPGASDSLAIADLVSSAN